MKFNWQSWIIFAVAVLIPAGIVGSSNYGIFPEMRGTMIALLIVTVGAAALTHNMADEPDQTLRQFGLVAVVLLGFVLYANVVSHVSYQRELLASQVSVGELHAEEDRASALADQAVKRQLELSRAEAERLKAQRSLLLQLPTNQRRLPAVPSQSAQPTPGVAIVKPVQGPKATPAEVRDGWNPRLLWLLVIETGIAILGLLMLFAVRYWDGDGNQVPDWLQRVAQQMTKTEFATAYPKPFARYGQVLYPNA